MNLTPTKLAAIYAEEAAADEADNALPVEPEWRHPGDVGRDVSDYFNRSE